MYVLVREQNTLTLFVGVDMFYEQRLCFGSRYRYDVASTGTQADCATK